MRGSFGLFCCFSRNLPRIHFGLHCNASAKIPWKGLFQITQFRLLILKTKLHSWKVERNNVSPCFPLHPAFSTPQGPVPRTPYSGTPAPRFPPNQSLRWPIYIFHPVDKTKLSCNTPYPRSITVSLETYPLYLFVSSFANQSTFVYLIIFQTWRFFKVSVWTSLINRLQELWDAQLSIC